MNLNYFNNLQKIMLSNLLIVSNKKVCVYIHILLDANNCD